MGTSEPAGGGGGGGGGGCEGTGLGLETGTERMLPKLGIMLGTEVLSGTVAGEVPKLPS